MTVRDHSGVVIDQFMGLWKRGDADSTPLDHFTDSNNIQHIANSAFGTRPGLGVSQTVAVPLQNVKRFYNYPTQTGNTLIVLCYSAGVGTIYHIINAATVYGPILTITGMQDFAFVPYAGRAYISPIGYYTQTSLSGTLNIELGLSGEFLYVYAGDGTAARKAAGVALTGNQTIANGAAGHTDPGFKIFAWVGETASGYLTPPEAAKSFTTTAGFSVSFSAVPTSGSSEFTKRFLVSTKTITSFNGDLTGYQFFFVPNAQINDDTTTTLSNISFYDADLLDDATHLLENFSQISAGAVLSIYHDRLVVGATYADNSLFLVSAPGEPEAIDQIDGLMLVPPDGNPLTNGWEHRDIFYAFKRNRTIAFIDNGQAPSSWPMTFIDYALGASLHGVATVLDSGGSSIDYLIIANYKGINLFNGSYINPELSWKIQDFWIDEDQSLYRNIQMVNDPVTQQLYCIIPDKSLLVGNYLLGMTAKLIRWEPWTFPMGVNTVAIVGISDIIIGADNG